MNVAEKLEFIQASINELLKKEIQITPDTVLLDIGLDSLDIVELEMKYEETFNVELKNPDFPIHTVADLINAMSL